VANQPDNGAPVTPPPAPRGSPPTEGVRPWWRPSPRWIVFFVVLLALNVFITSRAMEPDSRVRVAYSPFFLQQVKAGNVEEITSKGTDIQGTFTKELSYKDSKPTTRFRTEIPAFADTDELSRLLQQNDVTINAEPLDTGSPWWQTLLFGFGPTILFVFLLFWLFRRAGNVQNALGSFGRSRARRYEPSGDKVTFADVAGIEKEERDRVIVALRKPAGTSVWAVGFPTACCCPAPGRARRSGARRGGRTFAYSGGVESSRHRGRWAARVRDLFKQAKENAPAIVFIRMDAVGRARTAIVVQRMQ
jgi:cell division protease FtsH